MAKPVPKGEEFVGVFCQVPERTFDDLVYLMINQLPIDVNGREAIVSRSNTRTGFPQKPGHIPCSLTGRYVNPLRVATEDAAA